MYWEVPVIVQRLCGICPVSHHLCAAKAMDMVAGVDQLTPTAEKMRRLMHYGQVLQSNAAEFLPSGLARPAARVRGAGRAAQHHRRDRSLPGSRQVGDLHPQIRPAGDRRDRRPAHPSAAVHSRRRQPEPDGGAPRRAAEETSTRSSSGAARRWNSTNRLSVRMRRCTRPSPAFRRAT